ncbi:MAG: thioredoxin family protein, partial [Simkaniaceae bacterium]|nr:thioredoxin family protein [Simkaniaceae bacterium]
MGIKQYIAIFAACALKALPITTGYDAALALAEAYQRSVALIFTGSDWDRDSQELQKRLDDPAFEEVIGKDVVFVKLDYAKDGALAADAVAEHFALKQAYSIESFPTVVLLDPAKREISRTGLLPLSGREFGLQIRTLLKEYHALENTEQSPEKNYFRAKKLGCRHLTERFLNLALSNKPSSRMLLELYAHGNDKKKWRKAILESSDSNAHAELALLDYQESGKVSDLEEALFWVSEKSSDYWR